LGRHIVIGVGDFTIRRNWTLVDPEVRGFRFRRAMWADAGGSGVDVKEEDKKR
jgi:hypothetical protein